MKKEFSKKKLFTLTMVTVGLMMCVIVGIGEMVTRVLVDDSPYKSKAVIDSKYGWRTEAFSEYMYEMSDLGVSEPYDVKYTTQKFGFRKWGDIKTDKPKILLVGDSYVQSVEVNDAELFYGIIEDSLQVEMFAYGQAGYGTLQEVMIIEEYIDVIKPDLVILQTCSNDFIDNYAPMEYSSLYKVGLKRPYLSLRNEVIYRLPVPRWQEFLDKSHFLRLLRRKLYNTSQTTIEESTERSVVQLGTDYEIYSNSVKVTEKIIERLKKSVDPTELLVVSASTMEPYTTQFDVLFASKGIPFTIAAAKAIDKLKWHGHIVNSSDGYHWNKLGHEAVAESLIGPISSALKETSEVK